MTPEEKLKPGTILETEWLKGRTIVWVYIGGMTFFNISGSYVKDMGFLEKGWWLDRDWAVRELSDDDTA